MFLILNDFPTKNVDENFSFAPISLKLGSAYVSEDSENMKKNVQHFFWFIFLLEFSETNFDLVASKIGVEHFCPKIFNKNYVLRSLAPRYWSFWIKSPQPIDYRISLVSVSELGLPKFRRKI